MYTKMEIVFGRQLTEDEFDRITKWLDDNITDDYACFSHCLVYTEEEANVESEM